MGVGIINYFLLLSLFFYVYRLLDWRPEGSEKKKRFEQVVIIKNSFHPDEFEVSTNQSWRSQDRVVNESLI